MTDHLPLRVQLRDVLQFYVMDNTGSMCYANSAFLCLIWAMLSRNTFSVEDWGARSATLKNMFLRYTGYPFQLESQSWFQDMIQSWNPNNEQADCAEFTNRLLGWLSPSCVSNLWQRRVQMDEQAVIHDYGAHSMPITLQIDPAIHDGDTIQIADLLRHWHSELGMCAGLTQATDLICLHIDRLIMAATGRLHKSQQTIRFDLMVEMPVFQHNTTVASVRYLPIAALAHQGDENRGHYQALLRASTNLADHPIPQWLHCDDCRTPRRMDQPPEGFETKVTLVWICRWDVAEVHCLPTPPHMEQHAHITQDIDEALLTMLLTDGHTG